MYDSIKISSSLINAKMCSSINWDDIVNNETGEIKKSIAFIDKFKIEKDYRVNKVNISGSLHKFIKGNNLNNVSHEEVQEAIELITETTQIPMEKWIVNRLDYGLNLLTEYSAETYFNFLGELISKKGKLIRNIIDQTTLSYKNKSFEFQIYNKVEEMRHKRNSHNLSSLEQLPTITRIEIKFKRQVNRQLKRDIYLSDLLDVELCDLLHFELLKYFKLISRLPELNFNAANVKTPKSFIDEILRSLVNTCYSQSEILGYLNLVKDLNGMTDKNYYYLAKKKICELTSLKINEPNNYIDELEICLTNKIIFNQALHIS